VALIDRWRIALHFDRIIDQAGQDRWRVLQSDGVLPQYPPPLTPAGQPRVPNSLEAFRYAVEQQAAILSTSDTFLILGALTVFLMVVVMTLPVRTVPPRIPLCKAIGTRMAEDVAEPETRPAELGAERKPDLTLQRKSDDLSQQKDGESADRKQREADKLPASLPRWPFLLVGLVVAIFVAVVLYIIFRPRPDVRTADAYVMVHYATIAPRISGQIATVPVDDNDVVQTGRVLATLDPRDNETALASAEAAVARQVEIG